MTDNPKLIYKFPSRSRYDKFFSTIENIQSLSRHSNYKIVATLDNDDEIMNSWRAKTKMTEYPNLIPCFGDSKSKIAAVNADMDVVKDWDIVVVVSDDMVFSMPGFDLEIIDSFRKYAPNLDYGIHYPDSHGKHELCVMSVMGRKLYDYFGYLYWGGYYSNYADNEYTASIRILNKYWFRPAKIFDHIHPAYDYSLQQDALYIRNMNLNMQANDNQLYIQRRDKNFGLY